MRKTSASYVSGLVGLFLSYSLSLHAQVATPNDGAVDIPASTPMGGGPYRAIMELNPGLPTHTVYRPDDLNALGTQKLPVVAWGNGGCKNDGSAYRAFLSEIASYGYLAIAIGAPDSTRIGPARAGFAPAASITPATNLGSPANPVPPVGAPATRTAQLIDAINWATAENEKPASKYYHHLETTKVAVMGHSCGGVQAIEASADPRVSTTMVMDSGLLPGTTLMAGGKPLTKDDLRNFHGPVAYISGDDEDIAFLNANDDFEKLKSVPVFRGYGRGIVHLATFLDRNGGEFGGIAVAWLNWQLKGDRKSSAMFEGPDCGLCVNPRWVVQKSHMR
jgi:hypothetical protein